MEFQQGLCVTANYWRISMSLHNVVVVSRDAEIQELAQKIAKNVFAADDLSEALDISKRTRPDLILFDHRCNRDDIVRFSNTAEHISQTPLVVIGSDENDTQITAGFIETPLLHYLEGPKEYHRLRDIVEWVKKKLYTKMSDQNTDAFFVDGLAAAASMVGKSVSMLHAFKMIKLVAASQCNPILIVGEMGTGKELAAKAIHRQRCPEKEFVAVNCASLNANLLESELFGHEKGAFTSADSGKTGLLELAGAGCIFLDEISEMPVELQAKLLRVVQEKTFRKVGGTKEITCQATIIVSSNRDLKKEVLGNRFRGDLYHRLSVFPVVLSPLRSPGRCRDIRLLAEYFLKTSTICPEKSCRITSITQLAFEALEKHDWSGNVRELKNVIDRAILLETTDKIGINSIVINPEEPEEFFKNDSGEKIKDFSLAKAEQELIARALQETNWQKKKAAELLGISRATLYAKVKQHQIGLDSGTQETDDLNSSEELTELSIA
jgi:DNA-binding NtrC family response regulator